MEFILDGTQNINSHSLEQLALADPDSGKDWTSGCPCVSSKQNRPDFISMEVFALQPCNVPQCILG